MKGLPFFYYDSYLHLAKMITYWLNDKIKFMNFQVHFCKV